MTRVVEVPGPPAGRSDDDEVAYRWVWLEETAEEFWARYDQELAPRLRGGR